jgi:hypothetical protein
MMNVQTSAEFNSLLPEQKFDRRNFLVTSLAAGSTSLARAKRSLNIAIRCARMTAK